MLLKSDTIAVKKCLKSKIKGRRDGGVVVFPSQNFNSADQFPRASNHISKYVSSLHLLVLCSTDNENRIACKAEGLKHNVVPLTCTCFLSLPNYNRSLEKLNRRMDSRRLE